MARMTTVGSVSFDTRKPVDFAIIGSGSAGGIIARELSMAGFDIVVFEQGPYRRSGDFSHDELAVIFEQELMGGDSGNNVQTFRQFEHETAVTPEMLPLWFAQSVGGSSVHFSGNFWRFRESDFHEKSLLGPISGTNFADWPITYEELEPWYARVEWEIGVSGAPGPFDAPRSRPYPLPPMPIKSSGVLLERAAAKLGLHAQPAPLAILSQPFNGRRACINCGYCMFFGCEVGAKSSTLVAMIPQAEASGHCEIRAESTVFRIGADSAGRVSEVLYYDAAGNEQAQKVKAAIVCANGAETPRLLLMSASDRHPDGLANSSGFVGRNLMFNSHALVSAVFEQPLNDYKGVQVTRMVHDYYENDERRGFYGGGGIEARPLFSATPILHAIAAMPPDVPGWGIEFKKALEHDFTREMHLVASATSLAQDSNNVTLDPVVTDDWDRPALRVTYHDHADDLAVARYLRDRCQEIAVAAGAIKSWQASVEPQTNGAHLLGTCRMGDDPATSVVDRDHRCHDVPNLFVCDGSSFVTSGRGQPTMTIMALAFRAADRIKAAAAAGEI
jgi:choline dehydrogenase-like flavoprotein